MHSTKHSNLAGFFSERFSGVHQVVMVGDMCVFLVKNTHLKPGNHTWMSEGVMGK